MRNGLKAFNYARLNVKYDYVMIISEKIQKQLFAKTVCVNIKMINKFRIFDYMYFKLFNLFKF